MRREREGVEYHGSGGKGRGAVERIAACARG